MGITWQYRIGSGALFLSTVVHQNLILWEIGFSCLIYPYELDRGYV